MNGQVLNDQSNGDGNFKPKGDTIDVCREYLKGKCDRNENYCKFAHPPNGMAIKNGQVTVCADFIMNRCSRVNPPCRYFHPPSHLTPRGDGVSGTCRDRSRDYDLVSYPLRQNRMSQEMRGYGPAMVPGMGPGMSPGIAPGMGPGMGPGMIPGMGPGIGPGMGPGMDIANPMARMGYGMEHMGGGMDPMGGMGVMGAMGWYDNQMAMRGMGGYEGGIMEDGYDGGRRGGFMPMGDQTNNDYIDDKIEVCREFKKGRCERTECRYAHAPPTMRTTEGRVTFCKNDLITGECKRGELCRYYHLPEHLKAKYRPARSGRGQKRNFDRSFGNTNADSGKRTAPDF